MNKISRVLIVFVLLSGFLVTKISTPVNAKQEEPIEEGWSTGTEYSLDFSNTVYETWLQIFSKAVKITEPGTICHPFRLGQFGWIAQIRQLVDGNWVKVATTTEWFPTMEGQLRACAQAPAPGTYALFAYFNPAFETASFDEEACDYQNWDAHIWWIEGVGPYAFEVTMGSDPSVFPVGEIVSYTIIGEYPVTGLTIAQTGTDTSWDDEEIYATFFNNSITFDSFTTQVLIETGGCSQILDWNSNEPNIWGGPNNNNIDYVDY